VQAGQGMVQHAALSDLSIVRYHDSVVCERVDGADAGSDLVGAVLHDIEFNAVNLRWGRIVGCEV
jgi:hypothetical protein